MQKLWQFFKLDTPQDNASASSPPKRSASAEAERAAYQKRQRLDSEDTFVLAEDVTLTLKAE